MKVDISDIKNKNIAKRERLKELIEQTDWISNDISSLVLKRKGLRTEIKKLRNELNKGVLC